MVRPSLSEPPVTEASRMITVLSRTPETAGQGWVLRITSANRAVLLVPSRMPTMGTPRSVWPDERGPAKIPAPAPVVVICDVVPRQPREFSRPSAPFATLTQSEAFWVLEGSDGHR